jgi:hypothetical protein
MTQTQRSSSERIPGVVLQIVTGALRMVPIEKPSPVNDLLQGFLAAH